MSTPGFGRREPPDFRHVSLYPLAALPEIPQTVPVVIGVDWHQDFQTPRDGGRLYQRGGTWWMREDVKMPVLGGHAVCLKPDRLTDLTGWWSFYDQGREGACVGFAWSRAMTLLNRGRYDARWPRQGGEAVGGGDGRAHRRGKGDVRREAVGPDEVGGPPRSSAGTGWPRSSPPW